MVTRHRGARSASAVARDAGYGTVAAVRAGPCRLRATFFGFSATTRSMSKTWIWIVLAVSATAACEAAPGQRCDEFFSNGCKYPGMCVDGPEQSVCAVGCETQFGGPDSGKHYCKDETWEPVEVQAEMGSKTASMGCYCVPSSDATPAPS